MLTCGADLHMGGLTGSEAVRRWPEPLTFAW